MAGGADFGVRFDPLPPPAGAGAAARACGRIHGLVRSRGGSCLADRRVGQPGGARWLENWDSNLDKQIYILIILS